MNKRLLRSLYWMPEVFAAMYALDVTMAVLLVVWAVAHWLA
jgi:hypothetical protein